MGDRYDLQVRGSKLLAKVVDLQQFVDRTALEKAIEALVEKTRGDGDLGTAQRRAYVSMCRAFTVRWHQGRASADTLATAARRFVDAVASQARSSPPVDIGAAAAQVITKGVKE